MLEQMANTTSTWLTFDNFHFEVNNADGREDGADDEQGGDSWSR